MNVDKQYKHGLRKRSKFFCEQRGQLLNSIAKGKRLSDEHMVVASQLLKQQYPNLPGLFDPKQGQNMSFPMCEDPFVQILYVPGEEHWIAVSGVSESEACVYDSVFSTTLIGLH